MRVSVYKKKYTIYEINKIIVVMNLFIYLEPYTH